MRPLTARSLLVFTLLTCTTPALAFDQREPLTIRPLIPDMVPNDGIVDGGTYGNPYVVQDQQGTVQYEIRPQLPDIVPNDSLLDAGSFSNPWVADPVE
jgi:hypothetical protein